MKMPAVVAKAKGMGVNTKKKKKAEIIRDIQTTEGNFPCFGSASGACEQLDCLWRDDCLGTKLPPS